MGTMDAHLFSLTSGISSLVRIGSGALTSAPPLGPSTWRTGGVTGRDAVCGSAPFLDLTLPRHQALPAFQWRRDSLSIHSLELWRARRRIALQPNGERSDAKLGSVRKRAMASPLQRLSHTESSRGNVQLFRVFRQKALHAVPCGTLRKHLWKPGSLLERSLSLVLYRSNNKPTKNEDRQKA